MSRSNPRQISQSLIMPYNTQSECVIKNDPPQHERGAALLTVLLLVAVMAVIAATALDRLQLSTRLAVNNAAMTQARYYSYAAETIALSRIEDLIAREPEQLTLAGNWLNRDIPIPVDVGIAFARITDANNCFNLNSLVTATPNDVGTASYSANPAAMKQFNTLMQLLQISQNDAEAISQAVVDWIDSDSSALPAGAEDDFYRNKPAPHFAANRLMVDRSELHLVKGVTPPIYGRLRNWVCTLPVAQMTTLNVNTLSPDQSVLFAMLFEGKVSIGDAKAYLANRPSAGYSSAVRFWSAPRLAVLNASREVKGQVQLKSKYFQLHLNITAADIEMESHSLINANLQKPVIVSRSWGEFE
jgi:general secretion pathway protein K